MGLEQRNGRYLVRIAVGGSRVRIGTCETREEALALEAAALEQAAGVVGVTLDAWGAEWLDRRETIERVRSIRDERSRWKTHVSGSALGRMPLSLLSEGEVTAWLDELRCKTGATPYHTPEPLSPKTISEVVRLVRQAVDAAIPKHLGSNPVSAVAKRYLAALRRAQAERDIEEPWDYLTAEEQHAVASCPYIPEVHRLMICFAFLTGLRQGEQFNLELRDLQVDGTEPHIFVRFGSKGLPPKNGRTRRVWLPPSAVVVCRRWLEVLPEYAPANPLGLVFPGPTGARMAVGKTPLFTSKKADKKVTKVDRFGGYRRASGIERHLRWHDLRHTTASSLVSGMWGRRWTLEEVREYMGHRSISSTMRYAHLAEGALKAASRATTWAPQLPTALSKKPQLSLVSGGNDSVGRQGLEPWTYGLKAPSEPEQNRNVTSQVGAVVGDSRERAIALLRAVAAGDIHAIDRAVDLAADVLGAAPRVDAKRA